MVPTAERHHTRRRRPTPHAALSACAVERIAADLPTSVRGVFRHLATHGQINEEEATTLLGGARQFRQFSKQLDSLSG